MSVFSSVRSKGSCLSPSTYKGHELTVFTVLFYHWNRLPKPYIPIHGLGSQTLVHYKAAEALKCRLRPPRLSSEGNTRTYSGVSLMSQALFFKSLSQNANIWAKAITWSIRCLGVASRLQRLPTPLSRVGYLT